MSLTMGPAVFGPRPRATLNFPRPKGHAIIFEPNPRRIRAEFAGETIVDSRRSRLLHETAILPVGYFPREHVRTDLLQPTDHSTHCPFKGDAVYWSVVVGDKVAENAAWGYPDPIDAAPDGLADYIAFYFGRIDHWFEEDDEQLGHLRDPHNRIDVLPTSSHVRVTLDGTQLAETDRALALYEGGGLPPRFYIPNDDVNFDALEPADHATRCAYKGLASEYCSAPAGDRLVENLAWRYPEPRAEVAAIADHVAFFNELVEIEVDGEVDRWEDSPFAPRDSSAPAREKSTA
jgi:uncharacterized protein (DUF427 family)